MPVSYGTMLLTASSPVQSFTEPITLAAAKHFLGLPDADIVDEQEALIQAMISAARGQAELLQGRDLVRKQYDLRLDGFCRCEIFLRPHLESVDLFTYRDSDGATHTLTENTDFIVDTAKQPGVVMPPFGECWPSFQPWPSSSILIRFTAGLASTDGFWAESGPYVIIGMKHLISHWYTGRLPFEVGASAIQEYPFTVRALLGSGAVDRP